MYTTIKTSHDEFMDQVSSLASERFNLLERVLSDKAQEARLSLYVTRETKQRQGKVFSAVGNVVVDGKQFHADALAETVESAVDRVRDELVREVRKSNGRTKRLMRKGGIAFKALLRFGRK